MYEIFSSAEVLKVPVVLASNLLGAGNDEVSLSMEICNVSPEKLQADAGVFESFEASLQQAVSDAAGWKAHSRKRQPLWGQVEVQLLGSVGTRVQVAITPPGADTGVQFRKRLLRSSASMAQTMSEVLMELLPGVRASPSARLDVRNITAVVQRSASPTKKAVCGNPNDMRRIRGEIEERASDAGLSAEAGYTNVDDAIWATLSSHRRAMKYELLRLFILIHCVVLARTSMYGLHFLPEKSTTAMFDSGFMIAMCLFYPVFFTCFVHMIFRRRGRITLRQVVIFGGKSAATLPLLLVGRLIRMSYGSMAEAPGTVNIMAGICVGLGAFASQAVVSSLLLLFFGGACMPVLNCVGRHWGERWRARLIWSFVVFPYTFIFLGILAYPVGQRFPTLIMNGVDFAFYMVVAYFFTLLVGYGVHWDLTPGCCRQCGQRHRGSQYKRPDFVRFSIRGPLAAQTYDFRVPESATMGFCMSAFCGRFGVDEGSARFALETEREGVMLPTETLAELGIRDGDEVACWLLPTGPSMHLPAKPPWP